MEKRELAYTAGGNVNLYSQYGYGMKAPSKTKISVTIWSSNLTPGHISEQNYNLKRYMDPNVQRGTIYNSQDMESI